MIYRLAGNKTVMNGMSSFKTQEGTEQSNCIGAVPAVILPLGKTCGARQWEAEWATMTETASAMRSLSDEPEGEAPEEDTERGDLEERKDEQTEAANLTLQPLRQM